MLRELRFAFATCQDWPSGYYTAYRDMLQNDLDWCSTWATTPTNTPSIRTPWRAGAPGFRSPCKDLHTYRMRHTLYKLDPDLQAAHQKFPFAVIWDDHEVANDYSGLAPEWARPLRSSRRSVRPPIRRITSTCRFACSWRKDPNVVYGSIVACSSAGSPNSRCSTIGSTAPTTPAETVKRCGATRAETGRLYDAGCEQEQWLEQGFADSRARWNIVGQQLLMAELEHANTRRTLLEDAWDGYPRARQRLLKAVVETDLQKSGVSHRRLAFDVRQRFETRLQEALLEDDRDRVRDTGYHTGRRR